MISMMPYAVVIKFLGTCSSYCWHWSPVSGEFERMVMQCIGHWCTYMHIFQTEVTSQTDLDEVVGYM